jgi:anti-sigma B factor antagonist
LSISPFFDVAVVAHRSYVRVVTAGELDIATSGDLRAQLDELWDSGWDDVVLDLRQVTFMDSSGLHILIDNHERAAQAAMRFSIIDGSEAVDRALEISGLRELLHDALEDRRDE